MNRNKKGQYHRRRTAEPEDSNRRRWYEQIHKSVTANLCKEIKEIICQLFKRSIFFNVPNILRVIGSKLGPNNAS